MAEKLSSVGEHSGERLDASAESHKNLERLREAAKQAEKDPLQKHIESLQDAAESKAVSGKEVNVGDKNTEQAAGQFGVAKELKADAYKKTLGRVRSQLSAPDRVLSKIIHQPTIEAASNVAAKTVARPSSFLGGSLGALIGSAVLVYLSRHNGFEYNYLAFFILFGGGYVAGALVELVYKLLFRRKSA